MNDTTRDALIRAGRDLFARHGFDGASVRAITRQAGTNLGAITYHFGSKRALFEAVMAGVVQPARERLQAATQGPGSPLERVEAMVRAFFEVLFEHPELPQLIVHVMLSSSPVPEVGLQTMRGNVGLLATLIAEGQRDGSIRPGDPELMALSVAAQPLWLALARRILKEGIGLDVDASETRSSLIESVVSYVTAGLAVRPAGGDVQHPET
jgi:AcrR family transcriptional regulator